MNNPLALIIDDEPDIRELLELTLNRMDIQTLCAENIKSAKHLLAQHNFDLCLTDMKLPDGNGLDFVDHIQRSINPIPVAVITAHGNMDTAIVAMKKGAFDFLSKPIDLAILRQLVTNALKLSQPKQRKKDRRTRHLLLGNSQLMREIRAKIEKVSQNQAPIYISGESGSGKELVAKLIHKQSPRQEAPFIAVNCGAIPHELMESEFFGHKKGSFTGATTDKIGLFQAADEGTLFLDEVADLPLALQVKLLRAIQEKKVRPIGEQHEIAINVRLLSATHKNLAKMVDEGEFRQDLYYRINVIELITPSLRDRPSDIIEIADHLLSKLAIENNKTQPSFTPSAINALQQYHFPGNVRELENILERALALHDGQVIDTDDLNLPTHTLPKQTLLSSKAEKFNPAEISLEDYLEEIEKEAISQALEQNRWNKTETAKYLGLTFRSLRYRLKKLGLDK
ncbi:MAG: sigma-54-dependent Fis family transcriptional regulator [Methylococcales bacterium]|nr:sigma-54-dependent Fis family transcriptional regulator [Methylococcales bacterium]